MPPAPHAIAFLPTFDCYGVVCDHSVPRQSECVKPWCSVKPWSSSNQVLNTCTRSSGAFGCGLLHRPPVLIAAPTRNKMLLLVALALEPTPIDQRVHRCCLAHCGPLSETLVLFQVCSQGLWKAVILWPLTGWPHLAV